MYRIRKVFKFESAHILDSCHSIDCQNVHGHSYKVEVIFESENLNGDGMVVDFGLIKERVKPLIDLFDHAVIVSQKGFSKINPKFKYFIMPNNPTAENMCLFFHKYITGSIIPFVFTDTEDIKLRVRIHETETGWAEYYEY